MRKLFVVVSFALVLTGMCVAQGRKAQEPFPSEVVIGRDSFFDFGPPFNDYDLTFLRSEGEKTDVERVSLTPPADTCDPRAEIEMAQVRLDESLTSILHGTDPCRIPEKASKVELKRRNKGRVFSGMAVSIQVECAGGTRVIRADILDRDIFADQSKTPQYTSWSRMLFEKLDKATGQSPWDKPVFPIAETSPVVPATEPSTALQAIADGKYDAIFGKDSDRPSELYRLARNVPRQPFIELTKSDPVRPVTYDDPLYPPIAKAARVHGVIDFHLVVGSDGSANNVDIDSGPKMLWQSTKDAIAKWKFAVDEAGRPFKGLSDLG